MNEPSRPEDPHSHPVIGSKNWYQEAEMYHQSGYLGRDNVNCPISLKNRAGAHAMLVTNKKPTNQSAFLFGSSSTRLGRARCSATHDKQKPHD